MPETSIETLRIGGLLRCCCETWEGTENKHALDRIICPHCDSVMRREPGGVWKWSPDDK